MLQGEYTVLWEYRKEIPNSYLGDGWIWGGRGCQMLLLKEVTCRLKPVRRIEVSKHKITKISSP